MPFPPSKRKLPMARNSDRKQKRKKSHHQAPEQRHVIATSSSPSSTMHRWPVPPQPRSRGRIATTAGDGSASSSSFTSVDLARLRSLSETATNLISEEENQQSMPKTRVVEWSKSDHRNFVSAIYDLGMRQSSPAVILANMTMKEKESLTGDRLKSHLQKYRKNKNENKEKFMKEYELGMARLMDGWAGTLMTAKNHAPPGEQASLLSYSVMNEKNLGNAALPSPRFPREQPADLLDHFAERPVMIMPSMTEEEKRSSMGKSIMYSLELFQELKRHLLQKRGEARNSTTDGLGNTDQTRTVPEEEEDRKMSPQRKRVSPKRPKQQNRQPNDQVSLVRGKRSLSSTPSSSTTTSTSSSSASTSPRFLSLPKVASQLPHHPLPQPAAVATVRTSIAQANKMAQLASHCAQEYATKKALEERAAVAVAATASAPTSSLQVSQTLSRVAALQQRRQPQPRAPIGWAMRPTHTATAAWPGPAAAVTALQRLNFPTSTPVARNTAVTHPLARTTMDQLIQHRIAAAAGKSAPLKSSSASYNEKSKRGHHRHHDE